MIKIPNLFLLLVLFCLSELSYSRQPISFLDLQFNSKILGANLILSDSKYFPIVTERLNNNSPIDTVETGQTLDKISKFPSKFLDIANRKISALHKQIGKQSGKYIKRLLKEESRLRQQFSSRDSGVARNVFSTNSEKEYTSLLAKLKSDTTSIAPRNISGEYYPYIDSLQTTLFYLNKNKQLLNEYEIPPEKVESTLKNLLVLQSKMQDADQIKQYIQQRKEVLKQYISKFINQSPGIITAYNNYNKQLYYYSAQIKEYREDLNDPGKMTKLTLNILDKVPAFAGFIRKNSILSSIFNLNGTVSPSVVGQGLPTRDAVMASVQSQLSPVSNPNISSFVEQKIQSASGVVDKLRDKLQSFNNTNADVDLPNFHPNDQKTKSFLKRLQLGADLQTVHGNYYFPTTTDFGISLGYKVDSKNVVGIGGSFNMGWGRDISHVQLTGQGAGVRSFADINIKKNFFVSGGFEYNYQQPFDPLHLPQIQSWTKSGLLGISKKTSSNSKLVKGTKIQLLWDFLSYQQVPRTQPLKFRVGYSF